MTQPPKPSGGGLASGAVPPPRPSTQGSAPGPEYRVERTAWSLGGVIAFDGDFDGEAVSGIEVDTGLHEETWEACLRAARVSGRLGHPNLAWFHGHAQNGDALVIATGAVPSITLASAIGRGIAAQRLLPIARQVAKGLHAAHRAGVTHAGLTPESVRLGASDGRHDAVIVTDFGVASLIQRSPESSPPEGGAEASGDIYRFGRLFVQALGERSEPADQALRKVFARCAASDPVARFDTMAHVEQALCDVAQRLGLAGPWDDLPAPELEDSRPEITSDASLTGVFRESDPVISSGSRAAAGMGGLGLMAAGFVVLLGLFPSQGETAGSVGPSVASAPPAVSNEGSGATRILEAPLPPTPQPTAPPGETPGDGEADEPELILAEEAPAEAPAVAANGPAAGPARAPRKSASDEGRATSRSGGKADKEEAARLVAEAKRAVSAGKRKQATQLYHRALGLDSSNAQALIGLSDLYFDRGAYGKAVSFARRAIRSSPKKASYRIKLGDAYQKILKYGDAREQYKKAMQLGHPRAQARLQKLDAKTGG